MWTLIHTHLYRATHPPPGWPKARDGSILKQLARTYPAPEIAAAIQGLAILQATDGGHWLGPTGTPMTLRCLYRQGWGVRDTFSLAADTFYKAQEQRPAAPQSPQRASSAVSPLSALIDRVVPSLRPPVNPTIFPSMSDAPALTYLAHLPLSREVGHD